ncbi:MAG: FecR domain-containing protein [Planctomycetota bacterium]|nr:FecR domain-containing protein [Planctomycetota bacterium]
MARDIHLDELLVAYLAGDISERDLAELEGRLVAEPAARARLAELCEQDLALRQALSSTRLASDESQTVEKLPPNHEDVPEPVAAQARPDIQFGPGLEEKSRSRRASSRRIVLRQLQCKRAEAARGHGTAALIAAGVLVAFLVGLTMLRAPEPHRQALEQRQQETLEAHRAARQDLSSQRAEVENAQAKLKESESARAVARRELERLQAEQERVAQAQAVEEERRRALEDLEARQRRIREDLAAREAAEKELERRLAEARQRAEEAERRVAAIEREAEELGRVVFVAELRRPNAEAPRLVRAGGETLPLRDGLELRKGDRIETFGAGMAPGEAGPRPALAALEFNTGATLDLAAETRLECLGYEALRADSGQLYASVHSAASFEIQTACATLKAERSRFGLRIGADESEVLVEEGAVTFGNEQGRVKLQALQRSAARKGFAPSPARALDPADLWRGRAARAYRAAVVQANPPTPKDLVANGQYLLKLLDRAAEQGARLIVLPGNALHPRAIEGNGRPGPELVQKLDGPFLSAVAARAKQLKVGVALGVYLEEPDGNRYVACLLYGPDGKLLHKQYKVALASRETGFATPGQDFAAADTPFGRVAMIHSKDVHSGTGLREAVAAKPDLLLVVNADPDTSRYFELLAPLAAKDRIAVLMANSYYDAMDGSAAFLPGGEVRKSAAAEESVYVDLTR